MSESGIARRSAVTGAVGLFGLALAGCAAAVPVKAERAPDPDPPTPSDRRAPEPVEVSDPEPPAVPAQLDVEAVIAAHEGRAPTRWGLDIPGVVRTGAEAGSTAPGAVFLTLDACGGDGGSGFDAALIEGLVAAGIAATLFLNLRWIEANPDLAAALAAEPLFSLQNHGSRHLPLSVNGAAAYGIPGTASTREAALEVWDNHVALSELTGAAPRWFRPGTAHLDDVALSICSGLGERVAGFAINGDGGATFPAQTVAAEVGTATGGEIVIAHMNRPGSGTASGILAAAAALRDRGLAFGVL